MKIASLFLFLVFSFSFSLNATVHLQPDPLLVVVLMVKNEEHVMAETLQPYVDAGVSSYLILDTGSTDRTIEVTREFFQAHGITDFYIEQEPFVDFSTSRNRALELAEQRFPSACFMLMVDAEWFMHNVKGLVEYCKTQVNEKASCYFIRLITEELDYFLPRMMRCRCNVRYIGVVHETVALTDGKVPADIWFKVKPTHYGKEKSHQRMQRDKNMLLKYLARHPESARDTFYLAQTFSCMEDFENAYYYYLKRTQMNGWEEENYMAWYRLAGITEVLAVKEKNEKYTWAQAFEYYMRAFAMRPWRIEPLIRIAHYYLQQNQFSTAYIFLKVAYDMHYPAYDILFVEKDFYTYHRYNLLSHCAGSAGDIDIGLAATQKALQYSDKPHLQELRNYYEQLKEKRDTAKRQEQTYFAQYQNFSPQSFAQS
jgi:glycosyltransferase involved in cell wall biosynthesis